MELRGGEGDRKGGVHVADDDGGAGPKGLEDGLGAGEDAGDGLRVSATPNTEGVIGAPETKFTEEDIAQERVVVLAGVKENAAGAAGAQGAPDGGHLHEVGSRAGCEKKQGLHR
jgi:hypothetical protein